jgi:hypothetical protein
MLMLMKCNALKEAKHLRCYKDDTEETFIYGMYDYAQHVDKYCSRRPYRTPPLSGEDWVQNKLADEEACYDMFRMSPRMFLRLHELLIKDYGIKSSRKSTSLEALGIFLWVCGAL